eukprot:5454309-Prymnesium_polylepis.1
MCHRERSRISVRITCVAASKRHYPADTTSPCCRRKKVQRGNELARYQMSSAGAASTARRSAEVSSMPVQQQHVAEREERKLGLGPLTARSPHARRE